MTFEIEVRLARTFKMRIEATDVEKAEWKAWELLDFCNEEGVYDDSGEEIIETIVREVTQCRR